MKTNKTSIKWAVLLLLSALNPQPSTFAAGSLTPPGPPAPTMKTLDEIEPRVPISLLPYTISAPGSYYLTTNLSVSGSGITVSADNVTIDLRGFALSGVAGAGYGINVATVKNLQIRHGTLANWQRGVEASSASNSKLEELRTSNNSQNGMSIGSGSVILACVAQSNSVYGIFAYGNSLIKDCIATGNGYQGIVANDAGMIVNCLTEANANNGINAGDGSSIANCTVRSNATGIVVGNDCTIRSCAVSQNSGNGISTGARCSILESVANANTLKGMLIGSGTLVKQCTASQNGIHGVSGVIVIGCAVTASTTFSNVNDGIQFVSGTDNVVSECTANNNGNMGIQISGSQNRIDSNHASGNATTVISVETTNGNNLVVRNSAFGNGTCPAGIDYNIFSGNLHGPYVNDSGGDTITSATGWENFQSPPCPPQ